MGQFKALSLKNWILWKRSPCGNIMEVIIPIIFVGCLIVIRKLTPPQNFDAQSYLGNNYYTKSMWGQQSTASSAGQMMRLKGCSPDQVIGLAPAGDPFVTKLNSYLVTNMYNTELLASDSAINDRVRSVDYGGSKPKFCYALSVSQATAGGNYKYKLRFNQSIQQDETQGPPTTLKLMIDAALNLQLYQTSQNNGMPEVTTLINNQILQQQTGSPNDVFKNVQGPIYQQNSIKDKIYEITKKNIAIIFLLPLLIVYLRQTSTMLSQKQTKVRETMSIMGMQLPVYYFTWFIRYFVTCCVIHGAGTYIVVWMLPSINFLIPLSVFLSFDILLIVQSFFIQTFFTRAKIGVVIALLFFLCQFIVSFVSSNSDNPTLRINTLVSIIPHCAYLLSFQTILYAQSVQINASFTQTINNHVIIYSVISCLGNALFYLILTWYLQQVFPSQFSSKKHPFFCCVDSNRAKVNPQYGLKQQLSDSSLNKGSKRLIHIQEVEQKYKLMEKKKNIINIQNLYKQFNDGEFVAVNNLSLKMYNDNIFVLLGHNGAGKTTTISMLTGMIQQTSGIIEVMGETDIQKIRQNISVCPQHDTLYQNLTVQQHLELFGTFKGLKGKQLDQQVNKLIGDVNLSQKRDEYSKNLSGGQKRRLSVAMAFAGRSKVIILDEPTSGMDTSARRYIWELLKSYKTDRIILLTTHFMDEADYLGDRIGIMAGGQLMCCGSGHYLKTKFGVGYNITCVKKDSQVSSSQLIKTVQRYATRAVVLSDVSSQITMQLPMDQIKRFPQLFNQIDSKKTSIGILSYGISITTLQQVFLKVGQQAEAIKQTNKQISKQAAKQPIKFLAVQRSSRKSTDETRKNPLPNPLPKLYDRPYNSSKGDINVDQKIQRIDGSISRFFLHLKATILKRLRVIKRDVKSFMLEIILPMAIIVFALLLMRISFIVDLPEQEISMGTYAGFSATTLPLKISIGSANTTLLDAMQSNLNLKYGSLVSLSKDSSSASASLFDQNFLFPKKMSTNFLVGGIYFNGQSTVGPDTVHQYTSIVNTKIPTSMFYVQTLAAETYINKLTGHNISITVVNAPFPRTYSQSQINNTISGFMSALIFSIALGFKFASIISFIVKERQDRSKHQQIVSGMNIIAYWFGNFIYDYLLYLLLAGFSVAMCWLLKADVFIGSAFTVTIATFGIYGLAYIPFTYIAAYAFKDYGNAQAGFYFFTFVVGGLLSTIILVLRYVGGFPSTIGWYVAWGFRIVPSFCFGQIFISLGSLNLLSSFQLGAGQYYAPWDQKMALYPVFYLAGGFIFYTTLVFVIQSVMNSQNFMRFWTSESKIQDTQQIFDSDVLEMKQKALKADPRKYQILTKNLRKVFILDSDKKYKVAVDNLSVAIEKGEVFGLLGVNGAGKTTTFKMLAGQITSTSGDSYFNGMKISDNLKKVRQNLGYCPQFDALIESLTVREQLQLFYDLKSLPGFLKDDMVTQKIKQMNLEEYEDKLSGTLSGGNKRKLSVAMAMIGNPNIIFLDQPSTGMDPKARRFMWKVISRIASQKKQSTIILTTHSMQQAQALSTKLGIMVGGNFKCIGTPQHIKSKYGEGYEIQIKVIPCLKDQISNYFERNKLKQQDTIKQKELKGFLDYLKIQKQVQNQISLKGSGNYIYNQLIAAKKIQTIQIVEYLLLAEKVNKIKIFMENKFGGCEVIESFQTFIRFKVKGSLSVGKMFEALQNEKNKLEIDSYSIKQATVEQIFNKFAQDGQLSEMMA